MLKLAVAALIAGIVGGCAGVASTSPAQGQVGLGFVNATNLRIVLLVDDRVIETFAPGGAESNIYLSMLPPLPWKVEARMSSGRMLATMNISAGQDPAQPASSAGGADLSCGQLYLWSGPIEPPWPAPQPGTPGDCNP